MQYIGKTKIGRFASKPNVIYPQLRLPQDREDVIGEMALIYATEHGGKTAFIFVLEEKKSVNNERRHSTYRVLQLDQEVVKPQFYRGLDQHLSAIKSQISELKSLIFQGGSEAAPAA